MSNILGYCHASDGPGAGRDCKFPFKVDGKIYLQCATQLPDGQPWCKTDRAEAMTENYESWGYCHHGCVNGSLGKNKCLIDDMIYSINLNFPLSTYF